jgi:hypothetical protein
MLEVIKRLLSCRDQEIRSANNYCYWGIREMHKRRFIFGNLTNLRLKAMRLRDWG